MVIRFESKSEALTPAWWLVVLLAARSGECIQIVTSALQTELASWYGGPRALSRGAAATYCFLQVSTFVHFEMVLVFPDVMPKISWRFRVLNLDDF